MNEKIISGSLGGSITALLSYFTTNVPDTAREFSYVVLLFLFLDSLTGMTVAVFEKKMRSGEARRKLFVKLIQYGSILAIAAGGAFLLGNWQLIIASLGAIAAIEFASIVENLVKLEKFGVKLGPIRPLLDRLKVVFPQDVENDSPEEKKHSQPEEYSQE